MVIILIIIIILNFLIIIIIILLITMLTILLTTISLKNTIPSKHYLQFLSIKKHLVLIRKKKLKHIKLLIIHFIIIIIIIIYSSQGTVGNIRWSPTANSNMIHAHGILQIALKTSFVLCQPTNAAAHRDKCVTPLVIYSTTR